jgi:hypothetical protein
MSRLGPWSWFARMAVAMAALWSRSPPREVTKREARGRPKSSGVQVSWWTASAMRKTVVGPVVVVVVEAVSSRGRRGRCGLAEGVEGVGEVGGVVDGGGADELDGGGGGVGEGARSVEHRVRILSSARTGATCLMPGWRTAANGKAEAGAFDLGGHAGRGRSGWGRRGLRGCRQTADAGDAAVAVFPDLDARRQATTKAVTVEMSDTSRCRRRQVPPGTRGGTTAGLERDGDRGEVGAEGAGKSR